MDLVLLNQLATATARAETAEMRLHAMEREYGQLQVGCDGYDTVELMPDVFA